MTSEGDIALVCIAYLFYFLKLKKNKKKQKNNKYFMLIGSISIGHLLF